MIKINLLPQSRIKKAEHPEIMALAQLAFFAILIILGSMYFLKTIKLKTLESDVALAQKERDKYKAIIDELNSIKALMKELETKRDLIKNLMKVRTTYPIFMEDLVGHFPRSMWLSSLGTQIFDDGAISFNFSAIALDIYTIADLVKVFEGSDVIKNPELGAIAQFGAEPSITYNFTMKATYKKN